MMKLRPKGNHKRPKRPIAQREWENYVAQGETYDNTKLTIHATSATGSPRTEESRGVRTKQTTLGEWIGQHGGLQNF